MYHVIEFQTNWTADVEVSPKHKLEKLRIRKGLRAAVEIQPRVVETDRGLVEVADLYFQDGTATRDVPFEMFHFVEE